MASVHGTCSSSGFSAGYAVDGVRCTRVVGSAAQHHTAPSLVVAGCARNIAAQLREHSLPWVDELLTMRDGGGVVLYHDAPPGADAPTVDALREWAARRPRSRLLLAETSADTSSPSGGGGGGRGTARDDAKSEARLARLALCRNVLVAEALGWLGHRDNDDGALLQLDLDCTPPPPAALLGVLHAMMTAPPGDPLHAFGVVSGGNRGAYRDMWALRSATLHQSHDCQHRDTAMVRRLDSCRAHRIHLHPAAPPFGVEAAYNGLAIYRASALRRGAAAHCRYTGHIDVPVAPIAHVRGRGNATTTATTTTTAATTATTRLACEHVPYQQCLREAAGVRLAVAPSLLSSCGEASRRREQARATFMFANGSVVHVMLGRDELRLEPDLVAEAAVGRWLGPSAHRSRRRRTVVAFGVVGAAWLLCPCLLLIAAVRARRGGASPCTADGLVGSRTAHLLRRWYAGIDVEI